MKLEGRIALVTGGGRGIGRAIALRLASDGADVALTYAREAAGAEETAQDIRRAGRRAIAVQAAIQSADDNARAVEAVRTAFGALDILVHNAGIASRGRTIAETDGSEVERLLQVHAIGPHVLTRLALPLMRGRTRGDIVFISSIAAIRHAASGAPYSMGKAAMESLALTLAKEVRGDGIRVNVVRPGLVETDMGKRLVAATRGVKDMRDLDQMMPFSRVCQPEDIAAMVAALVGPDGAYVTGQIVAVSGGQEW